MAQVDFNYESKKTTIQCNPDDTMESIINKLLKKIDNTSKDLFFLYDGKLLEPKKTFNETANNLDKSINKMNVIVNNKIQEGKNDSYLQKSKYIICPQCNENIFFKIKNFKITLEECKNGHKINDILFSEFLKNQNIDLKKIKCEICKKVDKSETFKNQFYICHSCNISLCPLCKSCHDKEHHIIDYDLKDFSCKEHNESYISFCNECKKDVCVLCLKDHSGHKIINYGDIMPEIADVENKTNKLKETILEFKNHVNEIIANLNKLKESLDEYYKIYNDCLSNFDSKKRNYYIIQNTNEINNFNFDFMNILKTIGNEKKIGNKLKNILNLFYKIEQKEEIKDNKDNKDEEKDILLKKSKIKFNTDYEIYEILALQDGRILTMQGYEINNEKKYKACIYNIDYDFVICDICMDIDYGYIIQMEDNNIIKYTSMENEIKVIKIKKYSMEEIQSIKTYFSYVYKLSNNKILIIHGDENLLYLFQNGKLVFDKKITIGNNISANDALEINEDEIVFYCDKKGLIGESRFLLFYDIKNNNEKKSLKIGNYYTADTYDIRLINQNYFIIAFDRKIFAIDIKNRKIIHERKIGDSIIYLFQIDKKYILVNNFFLCRIGDSGKIINSSTIKLKNHEIFRGIYTKNLIFIVKDKKNTVKIKNIFKLI